jgi:uncharacterized membrane protein YfcA
VTLGEALPALTGAGWEGLHPTTLAFIIVGGLLAGWVDAVVGGGGLIQLPIMLLVPGISPVQALATNKMGSVFGTATSTVTYARRVHPDLRTALPLAGCAAAASFGGAAVATLLPASVFKPVIVAALVLVLCFTLAKKGSGLNTALKHAGLKHYGLACAIGAVIGFYDGLIGPGTGSFLVIALVGVLGYSFLDGSAKAKIANLATNLGALALFAPTGHVLWGIGLVLGASNMVGGYLGSRMAVSRGSGFVRVVFVVVVVALILKLGYDVASQWW